MGAIYRAYSQEIPKHWEMFSALQNELIFFDPLNNQERNIDEEFLLPGLDSNQDHQSQNLRYYHYTTGQWRRKCKNFYSGSKSFTRKSFIHNCYSVIHRTMMILFQLTYFSFGKQEERFIINAFVSDTFALIDFFNETFICNSSPLLYCDGSLWKSLLLY